MPSLQEALLEITVCPGLLRLLTPLDEGNSTQGGADFPKSKGSSSNNGIRLTYFFKKIIEFSGETLVNKII